MSLAQHTNHDLRQDHLQFERLLAESRDSILRYIFSLVPRMSDADDIFQGTSLVLWKKFSEYERDRSFTSWACGIAYNEVRNFRRARGAGRFLFSAELMHVLAAESEPRDQPVLDERVSSLRCCLSKLPERDQTLIRLIFWDGLSHEDAARRKGLALRTVYNRMYLIRRRLMKCISRQASKQSMAAEHRDR